LVIIINKGSTNTIANIVIIAATPTITLSGVEAFVA
jgi:hypothetical protein